MTGGILRDVVDGLAARASEGAAALRRRPAWVVLCFHSVRDPAPFRLLLEELRAAFRPVGLGEGFRLLAAGQPHGPTLTITFDDADATVHEHALPELKRLAVPACVFVCTRFVEQGYRDVSTGRFPVMDWGRLAEWAAEGLEVGAHSVSHVPLVQCTDERARWEILRSRDLVADRLGVPVRHFAYPWGLFTERLRAWLDESAEFDTVGTTIPRNNYPGQPGRHLNRRPPPPAGLGPRGLRRAAAAADLIRDLHHRRLLGGVGPVVWRLEAGEPAEWRASGAGPARPAP